MEDSQLTEGDAGKHQESATQHGYEAVGLCDWKPGAFDKIETLRRNLAITLNVTI